MQDIRLNAGIKAKKKKKLEAAAADNKETRRAIKNVAYCSKHAFVSSNVSHHSVHTYAFTHIQLAHMCAQRHHRGAHAPVPTPTHIHGDRCTTTTRTHTYTREMSDADPSGPAADCCLGGRSGEADVGTKTEPQSDRSVKKGGRWWRKRRRRKRTTGERWKKEKQAKELLGWTSLCFSVLRHTLISQLVTHSRCTNTLSFLHSSRLASSSSLSSCAWLLWPR